MLSTTLFSIFSFFFSPNCVRKKMVSITNLKTVLFCYFQLYIKSCRPVSNHCTNYYYFEMSKKFIDSIRITELNDNSNFYRCKPSKSETMISCCVLKLTIDTSSLKPGRRLYTGKPTLVYIFQQTRTKYC